MGGGLLMGGDPVDINRRDVLVTGLAGASQGPGLGCQAVGDGLGGCRAWQPTQVVWVRARPQGWGPASALRTEGRQWRRHSHADRHVTLLPPLVVGGLL